MQIWIRDEIGPCSSPALVTFQRNFILYLPKWLAIASCHEENHQNIEWKL